jgi:hypothetical protein
MSKIVAITGLIPRLLSLFLGKSLLKILDIKPSFLEFFSVAVYLQQFTILNIEMNLLKRCRNFIQAL